MRELALALLLWPAWAGAEVVRRANAEVREGPGNYYPLTAVLPKGASVEVVEARGGWVGIKPKGWVAKNCLMDKGAAKSLKDLDLSGASPAASPASVAAAVRGFATRFGRARKSDLEALSKLQGPFFSPEEYAAFKGGLKGCDSAGDPRVLSPYEPSEAEEGIGLGIAARVAARGLNGDRPLNRYLNLVGTVLSEASGAYDRPFQVYAMKGGEANAVAVPGARVFVSEGLISLCRDEAELAAVVAHEMTHVILKHGLKEMRARSVEIHADEAMGELEAMSADEPDADAEELEDWAQSAFEVVNKPRLLGYEEEADRGAALLLARAGYDPSALLDMIGRAGEAASSAKEGAPANPFTGTDYKGRSQAAGEFLKGLAACGKAREAGRFAAAVRAARLDR